jgi:hypothetical protein
MLVDLRPVLAFVLVLPSMALADGGLYLEAFVNIGDSGVASAQLFVYDDDGAFRPSGRGVGGHDAGNTVALPAGWYLVEVGRSRTEHNLQRLYVAEDEVTVVPSGWVSVSTIEPGSQPLGCDQWNAEISAYRVDATGEEHLVSSNRGAHAADYGMLQLPVGEFVVYFHGYPAPVTIRAGELFRLAAGYQDPVAGMRPQLALRAEGSENNVVMLLCHNGGLHVPAGDYWVSRIVPTETYPFEERVWNRVSIPAEDSGDYRRVRAERVRNRYDGEGSEPALLTEADAAVFEAYRRGALTGGSGSGFGGSFPGPDLDL